MPVHDLLNKRLPSERALREQSERKQAVETERKDRLTKASAFSAGDVVVTLDEKCAVVVGTDRKGNVEVEFSTGRKQIYAPTALTKVS